MDLLILREHHNYPNGAYVSNEELPHFPESIYFKGQDDSICVKVDSGRRLHSSYFIGTDWLSYEKPVYVEPKLNEDSNHTNYLRMLLWTLEHPDVSLNIHDLFEIKYDKPAIEIPQERDLLTPMLVLYFLQTIRTIVRKGLKKSYYRVESNLHGKIKGKVLLSDTIKQNVLNNKPLCNYCAYDEFGYNNLENRLLKKTLIFVNRFLKEIGIGRIENNLSEELAHLINAFQQVDSEISLNEIKYHKPNPIYSEYNTAIRLAKIILWRYGYSIGNIRDQEKIKTPPFWINMSKLFELYVLGLLKDRFGKQIEYHPTYRSRELDYLLNSSEYQMVIDAKYKQYNDHGVAIEDIRQISGYARMEGVYQDLNISEYQNIPCLIIFPDMNQGLGDLQHSSFEVNMQKIPGYIEMYKLGIKLPQL